VLDVVYGFYFSNGRSHEDFLEKSGKKG